MKYYSDVTKKFYNTVEDCEREEKQVIKQEEEKKLAEQRKNEARANAAKSVEEKRLVMVKAQKDYKEALEAFCKQYGSYHFTSKSFDDIPHLFNSFFDFLN